MFRRILIQWFWDTYDYIATLLLANIAMFFLFFVVVYTWIIGVLRASEGLSPAALILVFAVSGWVVITPLLALWIAAFGEVCALMHREQPVKVLDYFRGIRKFGIVALQFSALVVGVLLVLLVNTWFYLLGGVLPESMRMAGYGLGGLTFWLSLAWVAVSVGAMPWVTRGGRTPVAALKQGLLLLFQHPGLLGAVLIHLALLWAFSIGLKLVGAFLFAFAFTATFLNSLHDVVEVERNPLDELPAPESAKSWKEREAIELELDRRRMDAIRYSRTFKDVLRPWDG